MTMTVAETAQIITALAALGAMIISAIGLIVGRRNSKDIEVVRHATNSLTDKLVEVTRTESFAAGVKDEKDRVSEGGGAK
jgi:hypothetical protein